MNGLTRSIDYQGRITIPRETLKFLGIEGGAEVEVWADQDPDGVPVIVLRARQPGCWLCGERFLGEEKTTTVAGRLVCSDCASRLAEALKQQQGREGAP